MISFTGPRIVFTAPRSIELQEHTIRTSDLAPSDLVIRTIYTLISPGTEGSIYTGENKRVYEPDAWCAYPFNSGYTNIAEVVWCGEDVERFAIGDHVFTRNKHGAYYVIDSRTDVAVPLSPDQVRPETLIARLASISLTAPLVCERTLGASVLVFGLGNIGNLAAQLYTIGGATVVGVDPNPIRRRIAADVGVAGTCGSDPDEIRVTLASIGLAEKVDIVVDAVGLPDLDIDTVPFTR
ncbi:MAG: hypothetical protein ACOC2N_05935, partial [Spirochaetota bacterium]